MNRKGFTLVEVIIVVAVLGFVTVLCLDWCSSERNPVEPVITGTVQDYNNIMVYESLEDGKAAGFKYMVNQGDNLAIIGESGDYYELPDKNFVYCKDYILKSHVQLDIDFQR